MKRVLILIIAALFLLSGCVPASEEKPTEAPEASASPEPTEAPAPYKGGGSAYSFIWDNKRDSAWEEDIVYFADRYTDPYNGHPLLSDRVVTVRDFNDPVLRYSSEHSDVFYDASLKEAFIAKINALLLDVPQLTDYEIEMRLEETAALLHDGHSFSNIPDCDIFPMWLELVYSDGKMAAVVDYAPKENRDILGRRLTAINGKDVFEIAEMLRPFVSYEADTWFYSNVFSRRMILYS